MHFMTQMTVYLETLTPGSQEKPGLYMVSLESVPCCEATFNSFMTMPSSVLYPQVPPFQVKFVLKTL